MILNKYSNSPFRTPGKNKYANHILIRPEGFLLDLLIFYFNFNQKNVTGDYFYEHVTE